MNKKLFVVYVFVFVFSTVFFTNPVSAIRITDAQTEGGPEVIIPHQVQNKPDLSVYDIPKFVIAPCMWHVHSTWSDGWDSMKKIKKAAQKAGFLCIFFSDHTDMVGDYERYQEYYAALRSLNEEGIFVTIPGREISVPKDSLCHTNCISVTNIPFMYSSQYKQGDLPRFLDKLDQEGAVCVANHISDCKAWENKISLFHGIEMMNYLNNAKYKYYLNLYLKNKLNGWHGFVVGGIDLHTSLQKLKMGEIYTYIFPTSLTTPDLMSAIADGRTIATKNLKILELNIFPSLSTYSFYDEFIIRGKVQTKMQKAPEKVNLYKDGKLLSSFPFSFDKQDVNSYRFNVKIEKTGCYILEIPQKMVSSSFCFRKEEKDPPTTPFKDNPRLVSGRVFEVSSVGCNDMPIDYGNSPTDCHQMDVQLVSGKNPEGFLPYKICSEASGLLYTPSGLIADCLNPLVVVTNCSPTERIPASLQFNMDKGYCTTRGETSKAITGLCGKHYLVKVGIQDHIIYTPGTDPDGNSAARGLTVLVNIGNDRYNNKHLKLCRPETIKLDESGIVESCEGTPVYGWKTGFGCIVTVGSTIVPSTANGHPLAVGR